MTSRTFLLTDADGIDSLEAESLRLRLDVAIEVTRNLKVGNHRLLLPPPDKAPGATRPLTRHRTYYGPTHRVAAGPDDQVMAAMIDYDAKRQSDMLTIDLPPGYDRLGLRLIEPIGPMPSNHLAPGADIFDVRAIIRRWRAWLDRIVLPTENEMRTEMDAQFAQSQEAIFELLRSQGYDHPVAQGGLFEFIFTAPFEAPNIRWSETIGLMSGPPHDCFTSEGRAMLADAMPALLRLNHQRIDKRYELRLEPYRLEGQTMDPPLSIIDQMKAISRLPETIDAELVAPFAAAAA